MGGKNPSRISSKKFLTEDLSSRSFTWFSFGTTFEQKQQKFAASSPKTTWDKALSTKCTFASLTRQIKDSQGYAGFKGVKVRLTNNQ